MPADDRTDVLVIGAGASGAAVSFLLSRAGIRVGPNVPRLPHFPRLRPSDFRVRTLDGVVTTDELARVATRRAIYRPA